MQQIVKNTHRSKTIGEIQVQFNHNKWYLQTSSSAKKERKKESLFIYKLAKVNKIQTHEKLLRLPPAISDR
jgi:hypothetical protein